MLRFSLRTLAGIVATIGVACAALINASPLISSITWTIALLLLAVATVVAVLGAPRRRGFWTGFAIVGWVFTLVTETSLLGNVQPSLVTTQLLQRAALAMPQTKAAPLPQPGPIYVTSAYQRVPGATYPPPQPVPAPTALRVYPSPPSTYAYAAPVALQPLNTDFIESFVHIGQACWVLLLALGSGLLGQFLAARNEHPAATA